MWPGHVHVYIVNNLKAYLSIWREENKTQHIVILYVWTEILDAMCKIKTNTKTQFLVTSPHPSSDTVFYGEWLFCNTRCKGGGRFLCNTRHGHSVGFHSIQFKVIRALWWNSPPAHSFLRWCWENTLTPFPYFFLLHIQTCKEKKQHIIPFIRWNPPEHWGFWGLKSYQRLLRWSPKATQQRPNCQSIYYCYQNQLWLSMITRSKHSFSVRPTIQILLNVPVQKLTDSNNCWAWKRFNNN